MKNKHLICVVNNLRHMHCLSFSKNAHKMHYITNTLKLTLLTACNIWCFHSDAAQDQIFQDVVLCQLVSS